jgi:hypothetical protein
LADGEVADECAAGGVERRELSDDLRRQPYIWARSVVAGREPASVTSRFAGLRRDHEVSILMTLVGTVGRCHGGCTALKDLDDDHATAAAWTSGLAEIDGGIGGLALGV